MSHLAVRVAVFLLDVFPELPTLPSLEHLVLYLDGDKGYGETNEFW